MTSHNTHRAKRIPEGQAILLAITYLAHREVICYASMSRRRLLRKLWEAQAEIVSLRSKVVELKAPDPHPVDGSPVHGESEHKQPLNRADSIGVFGVLLGLFFVLIVPTFWYKVPAIALLCFGSIYFIWLSHWTYRLAEAWRLLVTGATLIIISGAVVPQLIRQWRIEHIRSELFLDAKAPGLSYPAGDRYGIKWSKEFVEVRLTISSHAMYPIQNVNLSIEAKGKNEVIAGMGQIEEDPQGCVVRRPRWDEDFKIPSIIFRGGDGSRVDLSPDLSDDINKTRPFRSHYDVLCQRLLASESVPLVIGFLPKKADCATPPHQLHVSGSYETTVIEGSKRVSVDNVVTVTSLSRWN